MSADNINKFTASIDPTNPDSQVSIDKGMGSLNELVNGKQNPKSPTLDYASDPIRQSNADAKSLSEQMTDEAKKYRQNMGETEAKNLDIAGTNARRDLAGRMQNLNRSFGQSGTRAGGQYLLQKAQLGNAAKYAMATAQNQIHNQVLDAADQMDKTAFDTGASLNAMNVNQQQSEYQMWHDALLKRDQAIGDLASGFGMLAGTMYAQPAKSEEKDSNSNADSQASPIYDYYYSPDSDANNRIKGLGSLKI